MWPPFYSIGGQKPPIKKAPCKELPQIQGLWRHGGRGRCSCLRTSQRLMAAEHNLAKIPKNPQSFHRSSAVLRQICSSAKIAPKRHPRKSCTRIQTFFWPTGESPCSRNATTAAVPLSMWIGKCAQAAWAWAWAFATPWRPMVRRRGMVHLAGTATLPLPSRWNMCIPQRRTRICRRLLPTVPSQSARKRRLIIMGRSATESTRKRIPRHQDHCRAMGSHAQSWDRMPKGLVLSSL